MSELFQLIQKKFGIAFDLIGHHGWKKFSLKITPWLFHKRFLFYSGSLMDSPPESQVDIPFRLELLKAEDFHHLLKLRPSFYTPAQIQERLKKKHICFLGWTENNPVHIRWVYVRSCYVPYLHRTVDLAPGIVYSDEAFTAPEFRRRGIYSRSDDLMRKFLRDMGQEKIVRVIPTWDTHLQYVAEKKWLKRIGEGGYWNLFLFRRFFWSGKIREQNRKTLVFDTE